MRVAMPNCPHTRDCRRTTLKDAGEVLMLQVEARPHSCSADNKAPCPYIIAISGRVPSPELYLCKTHESNG